MAKVYLICGKSHYSKLLKEKINAVILSLDEATKEETDIWYKNKK